MALEIRTADELVTPEVEARWAARRADRQSDVLQHILRRFLSRGAPVLVEDIHGAFAGRSRPAVDQELATLQEKDLILLTDGYVELAYPFSGARTAFAVVLPEGQQRYACCAIDALGIAAMLRQRIDIRSRCHHCGDPLEIRADADGPAPEADGVVVWVGTWDERERRAGSL